MKEINTFQLVKVPEGVEATVKARSVTVKGARGSLTKAFKHLAVDIYKVDADTIKVEKWFGKKKELAAVRTVCSHIENMFKGVIKVIAVTERKAKLYSFITFSISGIRIQDASCLRSFPHLLRHH